MDPQKNKILWKENATVEWVLCSPHFDDIVVITPKGLNDLPSTTQYQKIPMKQIKKQ